MKLRRRCRHTPEGYLALHVPASREPTKAPEARAPQQNDECAQSSHNHIPCLRVVDVRRAKTSSRGLQDLMLASRLARSQEGFEH